MWCLFFKKKIINRNNSEGKDHNVSNLQIVTLVVAYAGVATRAVLLAAILPRFAGAVVVAAIGTHGY